jgi:biotin operon repressor
MVLQALEAGCKKHEDIQNYIEMSHCMEISAKTIFRHINLIKSLGFEIIDESPYVKWPDGTKRIVTNDEKFGNTAYPLMILVALQSECEFYEGIIDRIDLLYKTRIERKAIGKYMKRLGEMGYTIYNPLFYFKYKLGNSMCKRLL